MLKHFHELHFKNVCFREEDTDFNRKKVKILRKLSRSRVHRLKREHTNYF